LKDPDDIEKGGKALTNSSENVDVAQESVSSQKCENLSIALNSSRLEPKGANQKGKSFFFQGANVTWNQAKDACENGGADLASFNVNVALADLLPAITKSQRKFFYCRKL